MLAEDPRMSWQRRLAELVAAGGAVASLAGCNIGGGGGGCGNGNPDPCICNRMPADSPECVAEAKCKSSGGFWDIGPSPIGYPPGAPDAAPGFTAVCVYPDAPRADASPADGASSSDATPHD